MAQNAAAIQKLIHQNPNEIKILPKPNIDLSFVIHSCLHCKRNFTHLSALLHHNHVKHTFIIKEYTPRGSRRFGVVSEISLNDVGPKLIEGLKSTIPTSTPPLRKQPENCYECGFKFTKLVPIKQHNCPSTVNYRECKHCGLNFKRRSLFDQHNVDHHAGQLQGFESKKELRCDPCNLNFPMRKYYKIHMEKHFKDSPNELREILRQAKIGPQKIFIKETKLPSDFFNKDSESSIESDYGSDIQEEITLPSTFFEKGKEKEEKEDEDDEELEPEKPKGSKFHCSFCDKSFIQKCYLPLHLVYLHDDQVNNPSNPFKCDQCSAAYTTGSLRYAHKRHIHKAKFQCDLCGKLFKRKPELHDHIQSKHLQSIQCDICGKKYSTKKMLEGHIRLMHEKVVDFKCDICSRVFPTKDFLVVHLRDYHQEQICPICGKKFNKLGIRTHMLTHSEMRKYECKICGKNYKTSTGLSTHKAMHDPSRRTCDICGKVLKNYLDKYIHQKKVHGYFASGKWKNYTKNEK